MSVCDCVLLCVCFVRFVFVRMCASSCFLLLLQSVCFVVVVVCERVFPRVCFLLRVLLFCVFGVFHVRMCLYVLVMMRACVMCAVVCVFV